MRIKVATRFRPFSHEPGISCLLPGTHLKLQIYPALISVFDLSKPKPYLLTEIALQIPKPSLNFTVQLNLENGRIEIQGESIKYSLIAVDEPDILFVVEDKKNMSISCSGEFRAFAWSSNFHVIGFKGLTIDSLTFYKPPPMARLSLGCHKAQDWSLVKRRRSMDEILPFWFRIGQGLTTPEARICGGCERLLNECRTTKKEELENAFLNLFLAGFDGILSPRLTDDEHLGFHLPAVNESASGSPLGLLTEGSFLIQKMFIQKIGNEVKILPQLPPSFHSGRLVDFTLEGVGTFSLEWSKKLLKKMTVLPDTPDSIQFSFQSKIQSCRVRTNFKEKGSEFLTPLNLTLISGVTYVFDRFQK